MVRYFEDTHAGEIYELGSASLGLADMIAFAERYDPQPFHVDPSAADQSVFSGLIASGVQTLGIFMRLFATGFLNQTTSLGSPGMDELRWHVPVRPDDVLTGHLEILTARESQSRADRGILNSRGSLTNQHGDTALSLLVTNFIGRRPRQPRST